MIGHLSPGTVIAGYEIQSPVGRGGMGDVYLARRDGETRSVALKLLSVSLARETRFRDRFERESHLATSLEHPHIVPVYATGEVEGVRYIAMRYVDGPTLRELIDHESPLSLRRVCSLLDQIASALDDAHGIGLVHRDIKPGNILIARSGASEFREHAYLTDFGVSKYTGSESDFTRTGQFVGTSLYAAPEQIKGEKVDGRTDVYAFGCVLFECLTGRVPFEKESEAALLWAQMIEEPVPVSALRPDLPSALDAVVAKAMAKEPDERYQTCGAVVVATRVAIEAEPSRAAVATTVIKSVEVPGNGPPAGATVIEPVEEAAAPLVASRVDPTEESPVDVVPEATVAELVKEPKAASVAADATGIDAAVEAADTDSGATPDAATESSLPAAGPGTAAETAISAHVEPRRASEAAPQTVIAPKEKTAETATAETLVPAPSDRGRGAATVAEGTRAYEPDVTPTQVPERSRRRIAIAAIAVVAVGAAVVAVLALRGGGGGESTPSLPPAPSSAPEVVGTAQVGNTLSANRGSWRRSPTEFKYQWQRCNRSGSACVAVTGEASRAYRLAARNEGRRMRVAVTASNASGKTTSISKPTAVVAPALRAPSNAVRPTLSGRTQEGSTLILAEGTWRGTEPIAVRHQWQRCNAKGAECVTIAGVTGATYALPSKDVGYTIRVVERASNKAGRAAVRSEATSVISRQPAPLPDDPTTTITTVPRPPAGTPPRPP